MERRSITEESTASETSPIPDSQPQSERPKKHPDHSDSKKRINRIKGQLNAIAQMIDDRKYCPNIIQQIRAATNALKGLEAEVFERHLRGCVKKTFQSKDAFEINEKIEEVMRLLSK